MAREHGKTTANQRLVFVRSVYRWAIKHDKYSGLNPTVAVGFFKPVERERHLSADEKRRLAESLELEPDRDIQDFIVLLMATGARKMNVAMACWEEVKFSARLWLIPESKTKNAKPAIIALRSAAMKCFERRHRDAQKPSSGWVFPSQISALGFRANMDGKVKLVLARAGIKDFRIHDFRQHADSPIMPSAP